MKLVCIEKPCAIARFAGGGGADVDDRGGLMAYALGTKAIKRLCYEQNPIGWQKAKLSPVLFKSHEQPVFAW